LCPLDKGTVLAETTDQAAIGATSGASTEGSKLSAPAAGAATARRRRLTRLSSAHTGLIAAAVLLVLLLVFILENSRSVTVEFLGAHAHLPLAVALLLAAVGGALLVGTVGAARIAQVRRAAHRDARRPARTD